MSVNRDGNILKKDECNASSSMNKNRYFSCISNSFSSNNHGSNCVTASDDNDFDSVLGSGTNKGSVRKVRPVPIIDSSFNIFDDIQESNISSRTDDTTSTDRSMDSSFNAYNQFSFPYFNKRKEDLDSRDVIGFSDTEYLSDDSNVESIETAACRRYKRVCMSNENSRETDASRTKTPQPAKVSCNNSPGLDLSCFDLLNMRMSPRNSAAKPPNTSNNNNMLDVSKLFMCHSSSSNMEIANEDSKMVEDDILTLSAEPHSPLWDCNQWGLGL
jgi:hypothetical protein